jgi:hypothetical protein
MPTPFLLLSRGRDMSDTMGRPLDAPNPYKNEGTFVVTRGVARHMQVFGPFPDNIAALRWSSAGATAGI